MTTRCKVNQFENFLNEMIAESHKAIAALTTHEYNEQFVLMTKAQLAVCEHIRIAYITHFRKLK